MLAWVAEREYIHRKAGKCGCKLAVSVIALPRAVSAPPMHCISAQWGSQRKMSTKCFPFSSIWSDPWRFWPFIMSSNCLVILQLLLPSFWRCCKASYEKHLQKVKACIPFHLNLRVRTFWMLHKPFALKIHYGTRSRGIWPGHIHRKTRIHPCLHYALEL